MGMLFCKDWQVVGSECSWTLHDHMQALDIIIYCCVITLIGIRMVLGCDFRNILFSMVTSIPLVVSTVLESLYFANGRIIDQRTTAYDNSGYEDYWRMHRMYHILMLVIAAASPVYMIITFQKS